MPPPHRVEALGGSRYSDCRYSDNHYSDISKWVMQWLRVRVRIRVRDRVRVRVSVICAFSEAFVGIAAVGIAVDGIAACTRRH